MPQVAVMNRLLSADKGMRLYSLLLDNGIAFDAPCGGRGVCGNCRAIITTPDGTLTGGVTAAEQKALNADQLAAGWRLICEFVIEEDIKVTLRSGDADIMSDVSAEGELNPSVELRHVDLKKPTASDQRPDCQRLADECGLTPDVTMMRRLPYALRDARFGVDVVGMNGRLLDIGKIDKTYGVAIDIGTTTMVAYLVDLATGDVIDRRGCMNPQRIHGGDVITRIDHASKSDEAAAELQSVVVGQLDALISELADANGISPDNIYHVVVVGNTTMMHLFANLPAKWIALAPFIPVTTSALQLDARELGFGLKHAVVTIGPCVSGYVGADTVACVLDCGMDVDSKLNLMIDIGTNGEMALGDKDGIICCSTAAGPALEGAHIKCGMGGVTGAISAVKTGGDKLEYSVIGGGAPRGICGSGLVDVIACMLNKEYIDDMGTMDDEAMGELYCEYNDRPALTLANDIIITQQDVREVQLAKAAIAAGVETLIAEYGCSYDDIAHLYIAGGFGNYIDHKNAAAIGLIPPELLNRVRSVGNAAGSGALKMLKNRRDYERACAVSKAMRYVELSARADFQDLFVDKMAFEV